MSAVWVYRILLLVRGGWLLLEWLFDWGSNGGVDASSSPHPYVELLAHATAVGAVLAILAGLWFFRRWARLLFVLLLAFAVIRSAVRPHHFIAASHSVFVTVNLLVLMLTGAIVAMSFLPPVRDMFASQT